MLPRSNLGLSQDLQVTSRLGLTIKKFTLPTSLLSSFPITADKLRIVWIVCVWVTIDDFDHPRELGFPAQTCMTQEVTVAGLLV